MVGRAVAVRPPRQRGEASAAMSVDDRGSLAAHHRINSRY